MVESRSAKQGARRFTLRGHGVWRFFIACDLGEGVLRYWTGGPDANLSRMIYSENRDERATARAALDALNENAYYIGVELSKSQKSRMEELPNPEGIASMRGIDEEFMGKRSGSFCHKGGWMLDLYTEGEDGQPLLEITGIMTSRFCKPSDRPNCESVFGREHVFKR